MAFNPNQLVHPFLLELKPYIPGKPIAETQRELGLKQVYKLASNENPLGTSKRVTEKLKTELAELARYPDGNAFELKEAISAHLKINADQIILGNGSEDVLRQIMQTFVWGDQEIIISEYSFIAYRILAKGLGLNIHLVPTQDYQIDLNAILKQVNDKTRMIILDNPSNPCGGYIKSKELNAFLQQLRTDIVVVLDEAYYEYMLQPDYPQTITLLAKYPNLIVTRTFSKVYGLAGLRVGFGVASENMVALINRIRQPFNVNHLAQIAAKEALMDRAYVQESIHVNEQGKLQFLEGLAKLSIPYLFMNGNFITVDLKHYGSDIYERMLKKGIIIRPLAPYGLINFYRITIGLEHENAACLKVLEELR